MQEKDWLSIEETTFKARFKKSPILRSKLKGIQRNIKYLQEQREK
jgi:epoxyqueuosine reductase QueG